MTLDPFEAMLRELERGLENADDPATRIDFDRLGRTGIPEVIYAESKSDEAVANACTISLARSARVIVSRITVERTEQVRRLLANPSITVEREYPGSTVVFVRPDARMPQPRGFVAILTAGTSDLAAAGEAATMVREIGCRVEVIADVGVAGLHRLVRPLRRVLVEGADVLVVVAGMDGALPSVVAGLVNVPVIGLPTSVGYGVAHGGTAALNTMLSSCAPGLTVVNVDNGVGAGAAAARIARRAT